MGRLGSYASLKLSSEFSLVYKGAKKWHCSCAVIFYQETDERKVGFTASKKVGNAVKRNLAKRRLRAVFVELQDELRSGTYIFVAKEAINNTNHSELKSSLLWSFKRLECLKK